MLLIVLLALALPAASTLQAQRLFGAGEDAFVLPRRELRWTLGGRWTVHDELLSDAGKRVPLGTSFTTALGVASTSWLGVTQLALRDALGDPSATVSAGDLRLREALHRTSMPLTIEAGVTSRLTIGISVPVVFTYASAVADLNRNNPSSANVALNPGRTNTAAAAAAATVLSQATAAVTALQSAYPACFGASPAPSCAPTIALSGNVAWLGSGVSLGYGATGRFAPIAGGTLHTQLLSRFAALNTALRAALGVGSDPLTARPTAAPVRMGLNDLNAMLMTPAFGIDADTLTSLERTALGDVELSARYLLGSTLAPVSRDSAASIPVGLRWRAVAGVTVRLPMAARRYLGQLLDPGAGDGAPVLELRSTADIAAGRHFWASITGRYGSVFADREMRRVPVGVGEIFPQSGRILDVSRQLGDYAELEATPRWMFNDYFAVSAVYLLFMRRGDRYAMSRSGAVAAICCGLPAPAAPDATLLNTSHQTAHRVGIGLTYSSLVARDRGTSGFPFEVRYQRLQTVAGEGTPFTSEDRLEFRLYTGLFGRR